ncbi:galactokinase [Marmoricola sp. OAE513]|uniref:galactokinase n=1 Tax=Marmoricola sp. OAE513 TaxID=2817894 RepID=UPI001AEA9966
MSTAARAPGRVNLIGEHLDYNGGRCLPIAIDRTTTATVDLAEVPRRSSTASSRGWEAYVDGVLAELGVDQPLAVSVHSDVPVGAGLSSSAALTCSVALAVDALLGPGRSREELRDACIRAENEHVGVPSGGLDQTAALFSRPGTALLIDFATGDLSHVAFDPGADGVALLVVDSGVRHRLRDGSYGDRAAECRRAADELGLEHLAHAGYEDLGRLSEDSLRRRARHVVTEQLRVDAFAAATQDGRWQEAGDLMTASHLSLRDDFEVSCPELDLIVATALGAGALGARMTGGGFGGSAIVLCSEERVATVTDRITQNAPTLFRVEASDGAQVLTT